MGVSPMFFRSESIRPQRTPRTQGTQRRKQSICFALSAPCSLCPLCSLWPHLFWKTWAGRPWYGKTSVFSHGSPSLGRFDRRRYGLHAPGAKKVAEEVTAFGCSQAGDHLDAVIEASVFAQAVQRADGAGLGVVAAVDEARHAG